ARRGHLRDVRRDVVAGRELDDRERQGGDRPDGEDGEEDAAADVGEHRRVLPLLRHFQKNVAGREMPGVLPSGLLYMRDGMLPMLFFTTRTPMAAGPWPTTPMMKTSSAAIFQMSLPSWIRSFPGTPKAFFHFSISSFIRGSGSFPCAPAERNHFA